MHLKTKEHKRIEKKMPDYSKSKIYKIVDNTNGNIYIGSTTQSLAQRLAKHTSNYKSYLKGTSQYMTSFEIIKNNDNDIILLENSVVDSKEQLHARERFYIETNKCVNKNIPTRIWTEYYQDKKEQFKEYREQYREQYSERIKQYRDEHAEKNKEYQQQYRLEKNDEIKEYQQQYREANSEAINERRRKAYREANSDINEKRRKAYALKKQQLKESSQNPE